MSNKYSYSKINLYEDCPFKYKLQYVDGNYVYIGSIATEFGTAIHECEEAIAKCIQSNMPINYVQIKNDFILKCIDLQIKYTNDFYTEDNKSSRNYKDKMYYYLEHGIYRLENFMREHPTYQIVGVEQKFSFDFDEQHQFSGAIDRIFYDTQYNNYIIHDIKSWAVEAKEEDLKTPLQFVVYSLALKNIFNCSLDDVSCEYDLPLVDKIQPGGTSGYISRGINKINKLFTEISSEDYTPHPTPLCNYCNFCRTNPDAIEPYKNLCPYYCLWERSTRIKSDCGKVENKWEGLENHSKIYEEFLNKYDIII